MPDALPLPPDELRFMERSIEDYYEVGNRTAAEFIELTDLGLTDPILDIGCGYGRVANGLWQRGHRGRYVGMDILPRHIGWCRENMTPATDGLYTFEHLDVQNDRYNPSGALAATAVSLDVGIRPRAVLLASVFTHMYGQEIVHYLNEIARLLTPESRVVATFFLINETQQISEARSRSLFPLQYRISDVSRCWDIDNPLHIIGHQEAWIRQQVDDAGLEVRELLLGSWCGRDTPRFQDTAVLALRPG